MKKFYLNLAVAASAIALTACGGGGKSASGNSLTAAAEDNSEAYMEENVNAVDQALPEIMVLPSDNMLKKYNALKNTSNGVERDYQAYLLNNTGNKTMMSAIQNEFAQLGYPLNDLEQTLKQLSTREATDEADGLAKDAKTLLLATAAPDIIIELDYKQAIDKKTLAKNTEYTLSFIDPYTNKVVSSTTAADTEGEGFAKTLNEQMPEISKDLTAYFSGILTKGREISVRITVENGANVNLQDESIEGETYADWADDYMDTHTVKGAYKLKSNTKNELAYTNVRIKTLNDDGTQYSAYQWGREFAKAMRKDLGVKVSNRSQGLADVHLVITGM